MVRRSEVVVGAGRSEPEEGPSPSLEPLFEPGPCFRTALRGYDRGQVDSYVAAVEAELAAMRRECDDLLARYTACAGELQVAQRLLACSPEGRELLRTSEQVGELLRVAADEAAQLAAAGSAEADRLRAEARLEADALLRRAHEVKEEAVAESDRLAEEARQARAAAAAELEELRRREGLARGTLVVLTEQVDAALRALAETLGDRPVPGTEGEEPLAS
jgi:colicin import membrane protein